jgi:transposase
MDEEGQARRSVSVTRQRGKRQRYTIGQKLAIVRECLEPGASLAGVALAHRANANMVRKWVVKYQRGEYGPLPEASMALLPVVVRKRARAQPAPKSAVPTATLEIELAAGVVRFYGGIDAALLDWFITALSGR